MKLNWNKRKKSEAARKIFRSGVYSAAVTALVLVLVILLNLIVRAIPSRYTEWDLSEAGLYTLSDNSIEVVKNLTQDVKIYYLAETGNEDVIISKLLDCYAAESSHLELGAERPGPLPDLCHPVWGHRCDQWKPHSGLRRKQRGADARGPLRRRLQQLFPHRYFQRDL